MRSAAREEKKREMYENRVAASSSMSRGGEGTKLAPRFRRDRDNSVSSIAIRALDAATIRYPISRTFLPFALRNRTPVIDLCLRWKPRDNDDYASHITSLCTFAGRHVRSRYRACKSIPLTKAFCSADGSACFANLNSVNRFCKPIYANCFITKMYTSK